MPRILTVARVSVAPGHEAEYVRTVHQLAEVGAARGQHLWLFRSGLDPTQFLEFSESPTEMSHRSRASRTDYELKLERRLQAIARYDAGAHDLWEEIPQPAASGQEAEPEADDDDGL